MNSLPTLYEYYTVDGIGTGLSDHQPYFTLNNKNITIYSGAMHYFRVHPDYWRDRLRKMRAAGLNAVETYVPWNLHEPEPGLFDFGNGGTDFEEYLQIKKFLKIAQEEDLFAIVRPGPYICAEWEFGGMPSWLLRNKDMKLRTSDEQFVEYVKKYFSMLLPILATLQFTKGGPVIAFQIENEYGNTEVKGQPVDHEYLKELKKILKSNGIVELLFTSDTPSNGFSGSLPDVLYTANFQNDADNELKLLQQFQPNKPLMVMEYWTGWFDHWTEKHHTRSSEEFSTVFENILRFPASVNMYMFHGGTNWGLLNGANIKDDSTDNAGYVPDASSYDYDAPLNEAGDYTEKYFNVKKLLEKYCNTKTQTPALPKLIARAAYPNITITLALSFEEMINNAKHHLNSKELIPMELLPINNNSGQSYGYIVYRKKNINISENSTLKIKGRICDSALILINGKLITKILEKNKDLNEFGYWRKRDGFVNLGNKRYENITLDILVENWGRSNYGKLDQFNQHKGLWQGNVTINDEVIFNWEIVPLEFKKTWINELKNWDLPQFGVGPTLYRGVLTIIEKHDTYIDMRLWKKGLVIVNGFVLSRYLHLGPQQAAYLPAPLLNIGDNHIMIFEHFVGNDTIKFSKGQIYDTKI